MYFWHSAEEEKDKNNEKRVDMISGFATVSPLALLRHRALFVGGFFLSFCRFLVEEKTGDRRDDKVGYWSHLYGQRRREIQTHGSD